MKFLNPLYSDECQMHGKEEAERRHQLQRHHPVGIIEISRLYWTDAHYIFFNLARDGRISQPFNFFHISHANQRDFSEIKKSEQNDLARDWVRVSTMPLEKKSSSPNLGAPKKSSSYGLRSKFLGRYQSQTTVECEPTPCPSEESFNTCLTTPNSPSPWSPPTESTAVSPTQYVCHAITTPDLSAYGEKSAGIVRVTKDQAEAEAQSPALTQDSNRSCTPEAPIPEVRETLATPERDERRSSKRLTKRISVRIRPMSQFSDFNADFIVPGSPLLTASRLSKRFSAQVQKYQPGAEFGDFALDESWEEDIDYSYEHAAESHCDFEWERSSNYAASTYGDDNGTLDSPESSHCLYLAVPEKKKEYAERRITGQFEAHLLLPGSAGSDTASITAHDSACDITGDSAACDNGIILRAACSSLSHRSIESIRSLRSSSSVSKLLTRNFRDELARAAEHLDDHIAFLNAEEIFMNSPRDSLRPPSVAVSTGRKTLTRARTDSDATCVTLCSDAETITPIETAEIITPPNSNHNSFALLKQYDEERMAKGLSFPASTIPGVIEFSPEIHDLPVPEDEFIPFI